MGQVESRDSSADVHEQRPGKQSDAYITPLADFLVLFTLTAVAATLLVVL